MRYKFLEDIATADLAFEAYGKTLPELFTNAALATSDAMANLKTVSPKIKKTIILRNLELYGLLFDFLSEIISLKDSDYMVFNKFEVKLRKGEVYELTAVVYGEKINPKKHELHSDVKAVTMHMFEIKRLRGKWKALVILDI